METQTQTQTPKLFTISTADAERRVQGRNAAIKAAKRMSRKTWRPVTVVRDDEKVSMRYRRGALQEFRRETRRRRR